MEASVTEQPAVLRVIYGSEDEEVEGHRDFATPEAASAFRDGFHTGVGLYAGDGAFTVLVPEEIGEKWAGEYEGRSGKRRLANIKAYLAENGL